jgi:phenylacetate-CoA ligase
MNPVRNLLLEHVVLPMGDTLIGGSMMTELRKLRKMNGDAQLQKEKLMKVLQHAVRKSPYYRDLNIPFDENPVTFLKRFPILTKQILRQETDRLLTMPVHGLSRECSSGTSGFQSIVYWTKQEQSQHRATQLLWWEWAGLRMGDPILQTGITPNRKLIKGIKDKLLNTYYLQAFSHSEEDVKKAFDWVKSKKDPVLAGYASSLYVLAQFAEKMGEQIRFKTAISWGDKLFPHYRRLIERVFGTKVHETYGSAEGLMMGGQKDLDHMYLMNQNVYFELLDDHGNEVPEGEMGHVVVTSLNAFAMPLIRYRIGDLAKLLPKEQYPSKRSLDYPIIEKVIGRDTDLVRTPGGKMLVVHSFTGIFEHIPEISQFRITQEKLSGITIEFVVGPGYHEALLDRVRDRIIENIKEPFEIVFIERNQIPPSASGKPQLVISKISSAIS